LEFIIICQLKQTAYRGIEFDSLVYWIGTYNTTALAFFFLGEKRQQLGDRSIGSHYLLEHPSYGQLSFDFFNMPLTEILEKDDFQSYSYLNFHTR
jgi:hypothetical protein